jgi:hypothetical protein
MLDETFARRVAQVVALYSTEDNACCLNWAAHTCAWHSFLSSRSKLQLLFADYDASTTISQKWHLQDWQQETGVTWALSQSVTLVVINSEGRRPGLAVAVGLSIAPSLLLLAPTGCFATDDLAWLFSHAQAKLYKEFIARWVSALKSRSWSAYFFIRTTRGMSAHSTRWKEEVWTKPH